MKPQIDLDLDVDGFNRGNIKFYSDHWILTGTINCSSSSSEEEEDEDISSEDEEISSEEEEEDEEIYSGMELVAGLAAEPSSSMTLNVAINLFTHEVPAKIGIPCLYN